VTWRNPHVHFTVRAASKDGKPELWKVEGSDVTALQIRGVPNDLIHVGDRVKVSGRPALRGKRAIWATNVLLPDGRELMVYRYSRPLWSDRTIGETEETKRPAVRRPDPANGIFTVWTFTGGFEKTFDIGVWGVPDSQLTAAGKAGRDRYSPTVNNPFISCTRGIPEVMAGTGPWEFVRQGQDTILLRFGEFDIVRPIHMAADAEKRRPPKSRRGPLGAVGYSVGKWENDNRTLVVRTTGMNFPYYDQGGLPQTAEAELIERWTLRGEGNALRYELTAIDPATFTQPITQATTWAWRPGVKIERYNCDKTHKAPE
jgi:hypothetical protein